MNMKITINKPTEFEATLLKVDAGVRYWEDGFINDQPDNDCEETELSPQMPCASYIGDQNQILRGYNWRWCPIIDIDTGQIVNWAQGVKAFIHYKVCDDFACDILDSNNDVIASYDGYVPKIMCPADDGYGDYIIMRIDENGFIQNWKKELIIKLIEQKEEADYDG